MNERVLTIHQWRLMIPQSKKKLSLGKYLEAVHMKPYDISREAMAKRLAIPVEDLDLLINTGAHYYGTGLTVRLALALGKDVTFWRGVEDGGIEDPSV